MPSRNRNKVYVAESYYHVYNRGIDKKAIFLDMEDYAVFLNLLKRYLAKEPQKDKAGRVYQSLNGQMELLTFCLIANHYHLLIYQIDEHAMTSLLQRIGTSYTMYFNKKYKRTGPLFQERFKASLIASDEYLQHISRYIHMNPDDYATWEFSSLPYYLSKREATWVLPERILKLFDNKNDYKQFIADYKDNKRVLDEIKLELANGGDL